MNKQTPNSNKPNEPKEDKRYYYQDREVYIHSEVIEQDEDVTKIWHTLRDAETGTVIHDVDWSPYSEMNHEDTKLYLELGCPKRISYGPLNAADLLELKRQKTIKEKVVFEIKRGEEDLII